MIQQHHRLTLEEAISLHRSGLISATALLYFFLKIRLAPGWKMTLHQGEISQRLGISKAAFYKAIQRLKDKKLVNWEAPNGLVVSLGQDKDSLDKSETVGQIGDSLDRSETPLDKMETSLDRSETPLDKMETRTAKKTKPRKRYGDSPYSSHTFINSLSNSAREKFFDFVREKVKNFNPTINDLEAWLAGKNRVGKERFAVYYEMFQATVGEAVAPSQDWANHPKKDEWIAEIRIGKPRFIALGGPPEERKTREAFARWAVAQGLVWGHLRR